MNKKLVISKTIIFIFVVGFVIAFKSIFGDENTLIGVTTATAMLMLLQKDLTLSPIKNTALLIILNVVIGLAATVASMNMWIAIPVNFIMMFVLSYSLCYNLKSPVYLPFSLQYLFLLVNPVSDDRLPMRFLSLVVGAIIIMIVQLIANRDNVLKKGNKLLVKACDDMIEKIKNSSLNKKDENLDKNVRTSLNAFRNIIYNKREQNFYLTEESRIKLNISVALEKISILLEELNYSNNEKIISDIETSLIKIRGYLNDESTISDDIINSIKNYNGHDIEDLTALKILNNISFIYEGLGELKDLGKEQYNLINKIERIPNNFKLTHNIESNYKARSAKFSYAVRIAIGITVAAFIMDYFHLREGRWIAFTMLSLVNPIYEVSKTKTRDRIIATIIGAIIVEILFYIFKGVVERTLILMISGYISGYMKEYKYNMICVTVSAIGAAAILGDTNTMAINRIMFVILGAILAILINKFILPYSIEKDVKILKVMYINVIKEMIDSLKEAYKNKRGDKINNLFIVTSFIEERLKANNINPEDDLMELMIKERNLVCSIYELYIRIAKFNGDKKDLEVEFEELKKEKDKDEKGFEIKLEDYIHSSHSLDEKLILSNIIEVYNGVDKIKSLTV
ncbi:FUSC family protein [Clostridium sardiniense]|uniref:FUSC family protein n=1 Tax=Clostridium sardiniense TaxID=29369 RepID=UPI001956D1AD|nr:FUSC family protein [Clostridium sardiniense]MBM7834676.1 putative membrane protein YwzB [Clostridium sardiniense]